VDDEIKRNCGASMAFPGIRRETSIDLQTEYGYWSDPQPHCTREKWIRPIA
jgi:hypothetical protein